MRHAFDYCHINEWKIIILKISGVKYFVQILTLFGLSNFVFQFKNLLYHAIKALKFWTFFQKDILNETKGQIITS